MVARAGNNHYVRPRGSRHANAVWAAGVYAVVPKYADLCMHSDRHMAQRLVGNHTLDPNGLH